MTIATIRGITVNQDENGVISWVSGAEIDADGANGQAGGPFAYRYPADDGLDRLANAGYPFYGWANVLYNDGSNHPLTDGSGNAFSRTSLVLTGSFSGRAVDSWSVPYTVVNPHVRTNATGVVLGCLAVVAYGPKMIQTVVADVGSAGRIGEISIAAAKLLDIPSSALDGGVSSHVTFTLYPGKAATINGVTYPLQRE